MKSINVINQVEQWLTSVVIDLNLCPFAQREYRQNKIRFTQSQAQSEAELIEQLMSELLLLEKQADIETSLLIFSNGLKAFSDFNDFLELADELLYEMKMDGVFQIASFHPQYQFAGTSPDDAENYTNRSPYPILHLLREASLEKAIERHPNTADIPKNNIALMNQLGNQHMSFLLESCLKAHD